MKKNLVFIVMICLFCSLAFTGCFGYENEEKRQISTLSTPKNVFIENETFKWDSVENAASYEIDYGGYPSIFVDNDSCELDLNSYQAFPLFKMSTYKLKVRAVGSFDYVTNKQFNSSDWSESKEFVRNEINAKSVQLVFNSNIIGYAYDENNIPNQTRKIGEQFGELPKAACTGYTFVGWMLEPEQYRAEVVSTKVIDITADQYFYNDATVILYAKWQGEVYTVTFDTQGGELGFETHTFTYSANGYPILPNSFMGVNSSYIPKKEGYKFTGWFTEQEGGTQLWGGEQITHDQTFYAKWAKQYTITFDLQGGSGTYSPIIVAIGDYPTKRAIPNNRTGYTFDGFYTEENGLGEQLFRNDNVSWNPQLIWELQEPWEIEQDITLYAYWVGKEYTCFLRTDPYQYQVQITVTYGQPMPTVDYYGNPLQIPQRNYYHFLGVSRNGVTFYNPDMTSATTWQIDYQGTYLEPYYILNGDWKGYEYTIKFDTNGANEKIPNQTIRYGDKLNFPNLTKTGYTVSAWWLNNIGAPAGGTFLAYANSTDFTWMPDPSYAQDLAEFTEFTIINDWLAKNYLVKLSEDGTKIARTVSFNINKYTNVNRQRVAVTSTTAPAAQTVTETVGLKYVEPARQPTEMDGRLVFLGWYDNELTIGEPFDFTSKIMTDITLYAKWEAQSFNSVCLFTSGMNTRNDLPRDSNGGNTLYRAKQNNGEWLPMIIAFRSLTTKTLQLSASTSVGGGAYYVEILDNNVNRANPLSTPWLISNFTTVTTSFTFEGGVLYHLYFEPYNTKVGDTLNSSLFYQLSISGTKGELPNGGGISSGVVYLTDNSEKYGLGSNMVIFDQDMPTTKGPYGYYITPKLYPPIREGFTFMGYYTQMNGQGVKYYNADMTSAKKWDIDADTTLYAYWEP